MLQEENASAAASSPSEVTVASAPQQELDQPQNGSTFRDCAACPEMVAIPAGQFMMGTSAPGGAPASSDESPQHGVTIAKPFALGRFEITLDDWKACVSDGGCSTKPSDKGDERRPVTKISWDDVERQYLPWLSRKTGRAYRLPTEAEWEYAARGGASAPAGQKFGFGNDESRICEYGNSADLSAKEARGGWIESSCKDGFAETAPVGSLKPNSLNLYDMHGNVWEWVQDCWNGNYQNAPSDGSAWTKGNCSLRVIRGGSWAAEVNGLRSADRGWNRPNAGSNTIGFRVARSL
jgi:formylglycine-generating enzyme required for sulfatase activity